MIFLLYYINYIYIINLIYNLQPSIKLIADVLRLIGVHGLKGDAHALAVAVEGRAAAVAAVDRRVDLDAQQLRRGLRVGGDLKKSLQAAKKAPKIIKK